MHIGDEMIGLLINTIIGAAASAIAENQAFEDEMALLPKEKSDAIRAKRKEDYESAKAHALALEIAEAGRARNFWGK